MDLHLIIKYCKGECSKEESIYVEAQMASTKETKDLVAKYFSLMDLNRDIADLESIDYQAAYHDVRRRIGLQRRVSLKTRVMRIAAVIAFPLLLSTLSLGYLLYNQGDQSRGYTEVMANPGLIVKHSLPDSSIVWLNSGSVIRYSEKFSKKNRSVNLINGEIFLDVTADKASPFYVNTSEGMSVYVYGTKLNVRNYEKENLLETTLSEGKVNIILKDQVEQIILNPGESALFDKTTKDIQKQKVNLSEKISWKNGKLIFRNSSIEDVLEELSRHFDIKINYVNHKAINYKYRATFSGESISQILDFLSQSTPIEWEITDDPDKGSLNGETQKMINLNIY